MSGETHLTERKLHELSSMVVTDPPKALALIREYDKTCRRDASYAVNRGGFLVDVGSFLSDSALVQEGIDSIQPLLSAVPDSLKPHLLYNVANGFSTLHSVARKRADYQFQPDDTPLVSAKHYFRQALRFIPDRGPDWSARLLVNYGNCLSALGRSLEAIQQYDEALSFSPDNGMAWGNLGVELEHFTSVSHDHGALRDALHAIEKALACSDLSSGSGPHARAEFEKARSRLLRLTTRLPDTSSSKTDVAPQTGVRLRNYVAFCRKHDIMLNFAIKHGRPLNPSRDDVFFNVVTRIDDNRTFPRLARIINELKENYAGARLVLYEACDHPYLPASYDNLTHYAYNLDYAVYGVIPAKVKLAFGNVYNILDKIALFLRDYLNIEIDEHKADFDRVWKKEPTAPVRPEIVRANNSYLYALYDVSRDLRRDGFWSRLRDIRNRITHRYLVPHTENCGLWNVECDSLDYHIGYDELALKTIEILRIVRCAVVYLIAFIDTMERGKLADPKGVVPPIYVPPYVHFPQGPLGEIRTRQRNKISP
jgi:tetratricopeptide (TPR) repeat protein